MAGFLALCIGALIFAGAVYSGAGALVGVLWRPLAAIVALAGTLISGAIVIIVAVSLLSFVV